MCKKLAYAIAVLMLLSACGKDEKSESSLNGWYTDLSSVARTESFNRINQAISDNECIYTTGYSHKYDYYATPELFFYDDGSWRSSDAHYGTCRFLPKPGCSINVINIVDRNTLVKYYATLWDPKTLSGNAEIVGSVYAGLYFGVLVYYDSSPVYYTYALVENKLVVSNGEIYTITSGGLIKDGTGVLLSKYDPSHRF